MGFYATDQLEAVLESCQENPTPPSKNRVWNFFTTSETCTGFFESQPVEPHQEKSPTPTTTASGVRYYGYRYYGPETGRWMSRDPFGERGGLCLYAILENSQVNEVDSLGLAPFKNNCNRPIPFKPEKTACGVKEDKKYDCPSGQTCDVDGVYPPGGGNPVKIVNGCSAECNMLNGHGVITVTCDGEWPQFKQWYGGGPVPDDWWTPKDKGGKGHTDWPKPEIPSEPLPKGYNPYPKQSAQMK